jgi:hypothetical protein
MELLKLREKHGPYVFKSVSFDPGHVEFKRFVDNDGDIYIGEVKAGTNTYHGRGVYLFISGDIPKILECWWKDDKICYSGRTILSNGDVYNGEFKDGKIHGQGVYKYANGDVYDGEWKDNFRHGQGTYKYADGDTYIGPWVKGKREGRGLYIFANGDK